MAAEVIGTKGLDFIEYHQLLKVSLPSKKIDNREEKKVDKSDKPRRHDVRIKVKINSTDSPCGFRGRVVLPPSNYIFCSHKNVLKRFSLFIKDDRRFCKICFQQGLIVYQTPLFHQIFVFKFLTAHSRPKLQL